MIVWATDAHIFDDRHADLLAEFYEYVDKTKPATLILSEWADPWQAKWEDILVTVPWSFLQHVVAQRCDEGLQTVYIKGNHDWTIKQRHLPGAVIVNKWLIEYPECTYEFRHGWERDIVWRWPVSNIAFWIADHAPWLMLPIYRMLYGPTPTEVKAAVDEGTTPAQDWTAHVGFIHYLWQVHADKAKRRVILGHTHNLWPFDGLIADGGAFCEDKAWLEIDHADIAVKHLTSAATR